MCDKVIRLVLSFPSRDLHPNARVHWARLARAKKAYREEAWAAALCYDRSRPLWESAVVRAAFYVPNLRRRDPDGLMASMKAAWDGVVDAGVLADDDKLVLYPPALILDRKNPRVEVTLEQVQDVAQR